MNVLHKVTLQALRQNRTRTIVTILGIVLSTAMLCAVTTFTASFQQYLVDREIYTSGSWHVGQADLTYGEYQQLAQADGVETSVYLQHLGYAQADGSLNNAKPYLYLLGLPDTGGELLSIHLTQGRMPASPQEIVLPQHYLDNTTQTYQLGDTLTLDLGRRTSEGFALGQSNPYSFDAPEYLEDTHPRTFTVVGFCQRWGMESFSAPGYTAFTGADPNLAQDTVCDVYLSLLDARQVYDFQAAHHLEDTNQNVLMFTGVSRYERYYAVLYSLAAIVVAIIIAASVILIYNAFAISVAERTRQFGLLSSLGCTKKQLRRMVRFEALALSAIGVPVGIICGIAGIGITLNVAGQLFVEASLLVPMRLRVSWLGVLLAVVLGVVTVLLSAWLPSRRATKVSAMEAIRQSQDIHGTKKLVHPTLLTRKLFGLPGILGVKYYKRSAKKYRTTVFSLFLSVVLFVSASSFASSLTQSVTGGFGGDTYDLKLYCYDTDAIPSPQAFYQQLKGLDSVDQAALAWSASTLGEFHLEDLTPEVGQLAGGQEGVARFSIRLTFVDEATYQALAQTYPVSEGEGIAFDGSPIFDQTEGKFVWAQYLQSPSLPFSALEAKPMEGYGVMGEVEGADGRLYLRYTNMDSDQEEFVDVPVDEAYRSTPLDIGTVSQTWPFYLPRGVALTVVYPLSRMEAILGPDSQLTPGIYVMAEDDQQAEEDIKALMRTWGATPTLTNNAQQQQSSRSMVTLVNIFAYGFIALISLVAVTNVFNTISTNVLLRTRDFAMLQSVGMTHGEMRRMLAFECVLYGTRALILGVPVSLLISYLIYKSISQGYPLPFQVPWAALGIACLSVFLVVAATMAYAARKVGRVELVEALKNENL